MTDCVQRKTLPPVMNTNTLTARKNARMNSPGWVLQRVLLGMCIIQITVTSYLAFRIFAITSVSSVPRVDSNQGPGGKGNDKNKVLDFDIGENEAAIVLAEQEVKPNLPAGFEVKWGEAPRKQQTGDSVVVVEVWSKAAVGSYLWHHILDGTEALDDSTPGATLGEVTTPTFTLRYRSGPGIVPETVPRDASHVVLVVNGRTGEKVEEARVWLRHLASLTPVPSTLLLMLGNEECDNDWVERYISPRGPVVAVLLTYDDPRIDNTLFYQWPLGVATYRQFPVINEDQIKPSIGRKYMCNLRATIHPNSSRVDLLKMMRSEAILPGQCHLSVRESWVSNESPDSMDEYVRTLLQSDLTLCPAGFNTETYRVYEALSAGSTPVIEDVTTRGHCDPNPWRLLKKHGPPVIWVKNWRQLPRILLKERKYNSQYKALRRLRVSQWYEWFKLKMRDKFISIVASSLLHPD